LIDEDAVKIFMKDTPNLKLLGHLLTNESSRKIMDLLSYEEMHSNQIAKKANMSLELVLHHLEKLEKINLVIVTNKKIIKRGKDHRHYKMIPNILILVSKTQKEIHEAGFLRRIFKDSVKFAAIGLVSFLAFIYNSFHQTSELSEKSSDSNDLLTIPLIIIIIGLILVQIKKRKKVS